MEETVEAEQMPAEELQALLRPLLLLFRYLVMRHHRDVRGRRPRRGTARRWSFCVRELLADPASLRCR